MPNPSHECSFKWNVNHLRIAHCLILCKLITFNFVPIKFIHPNWREKIYFCFDGSTGKTVLFVFKSKIFQKHKKRMYDQK